MGLKFPEQIYGNCFFVTTTFYNWAKFGNIDGLYLELAKSLNFCSEKYQAKIVGYVFMPFHIHLLLVLFGDNLSGFMRDFKKYIAQKVVKEFGVKKSNIWMPRYDKVVIYTEKIFRTKLDYIHHNPVKSGLVERVEDWVWSSAGCYIKDERNVVKIWKNWVY